MSFRKDNLADRIIFGVWHDINFFPLHFAQRKTKNKLLRLIGALASFVLFVLLMPITFLIIVFIGLPLAFWEAANDE